MHQDAALPSSASQCLPDNKDHCLLIVCVSSASTVEAVGEKGGSFKSWMLSSHWVIGAEKQTFQTPADTVGCFCESAQSGWGCVHGAAFVHKLGRLSCVGSESEEQETHAPSVRIKRDELHTRPADETQAELEVRKEQRDGKKANYTALFMRYVSFTSTFLLDVSLSTWLEMNHKTTSNTTLISDV